MTLNELLEKENLNKKELGLKMGYPKNTASQNVDKMSDYLFIKNDDGSYSSYSKRKTFTLKQKESFLGRKFNPYCPYDEVADIYTTRTVVDERLSKGEVIAVKFDDDRTASVKNGDVLLYSEEVQD